MTQITKEQADAILSAIRAGYHSRTDYPPFKWAAWDDRNAFLEYIARVLGDMAKA